MSVYIFGLIYPFYLFGLSFSKVLLIASPVLLLFKGVYKYNPPKDMVVYYSFGFLIFSIGCFNIFFINSSDDYAFFSKSFLMLVEVPIISSVICVYYKSVSKKIDIKLAIFGVVVIQGGIALFLFFNDLIREEIFNFLGYSENIIATSQFRLVGIGAGFVELSLAQGLGLIMALYLKPKSKIIYGLGVLVILVSGFLAARTFIIFIMAFIFISLSKRDKSKDLILGGIVLTSIPILLLPYFTISNNIYLEKIFLVLPWATEFINNIMTGSSGTSSSDSLFDMYFWVEGKTFLFGDGYYSDPNNSDRYYMGTDAGYMRPILYYGLLTFFPQILLLLYCTLKSKGFINISMVICFILFICNIKGQFIYFGSSMEKVLILFFIISIHSKGNRHA